MSFKNMQRKKEKSIFFQKFTLENIPLKARTFYVLFLQTTI